MRSLEEAISAQAQNTYSAQGHFGSDGYRNYCKEELNSINVRFATSLLFLRKRARTVRAQWKRRRECFDNDEPRRFEWTFPEGWYDTEYREEKLRVYISQHESVITEL